MPVSPAPSGRPATTGPRPAATFLAHLIAVAQAAPQTRDRQRAEAGDMMAVYSAARRRSTAPRTLAVV